MMMENVYDKAIEAVNYIKAHTKHRPDLAIVLGSGLGEFADTIDEAEGISFGDIPYFKKPTIQGHSGKLVFGKCGGRTIVCMQGRFHFYEGHHITETVFPVRVFKLLGINKLVLTNAAGGVNKMFVPGNLMIITDHINLLGANPLAGENDERFGKRFANMKNVYDAKMQDVIAKSMKSLGLQVKKGVYCAFTGPSYESQSEIKMATFMGADAAGMSTVHEAITGNHMGMEVAGISCITNMACGVSDSPLNHQEVVDTANATKGIFKQLLKDFLPII